MRSESASLTELQTELSKIQIPPLSPQDSIVLWQPQNDEAAFNLNYIVKKQLGAGGFGTAHLVIGQKGFNKDKAFVAKFNQKADKG